MDAEVVAVARQELARRAPGAKGTLAAGADAG